MWKYKRLKGLLQKTDLPQLQYYIIMTQISIFVEFALVETMKAYEGNEDTRKHTVIQGT